MNLFSILLIWSVAAPLRSSAVKGGGVVGFVQRKSAWSGGGWSCRHCTRKSAWSGGSGWLGQVKLF